MYSVLELFQDLAPSHRGGGHHQGQRHARERGVDPRLERRHPHDENRQDEDPPAEDARAKQGRNGRKAEGRQDQPAGSKVGGERDRDHADRSDVVDDRERDQEELRSRRHPVPQNREHGDRKGRVGGHRDTPTIGRLASSGDSEIDEHRDDDASQRRQDRQSRGLRMSQLAAKDLPLDLQRDQEEEDGHEAVVDPMAEVLGDRRVSDAEPQVGIPERLVAADVPDVGPDKRQGGGGQEGESPNLLVAQILGGIRDQLSDGSSGIRAISANCPPLRSSTPLQSVSGSSGNSSAGSGGSTIQESSSSSASSCPGPQPE